MSQEEWRIGKYVFTTKEEYEQAARDSALIRIIRREQDITDPETAKELYNKFRFEEGVLKSPIGKDFFYELSGYMAEAEVSEKKRMAYLEQEARRQDAGSPSGRSEAARMIWPDEEIEREKRENLERAAKRNNRKTWLVVIAAVSVLVLLFCVYRLVAYGVMTSKSTQNIENLKSMIGESSVSVRVSEDAASFAYEVIHQDAMVTGSDGVLEKYARLHEMNDDLVGWVSIEGTRIDYPVMQNYSSSEYYLHRGFDREESDEGLPFLDWRCLKNPRSTNLLMYGHNMKNGHMFADLIKYEDEEFFDEHRLIRYDSIYEEGYYDIVAVFRTRVAYEDEDAFRFYDFIEADTEAEFNEFIESARALSLYETGVTASFGDKLITLSTCEYTEDDGRFVVVAKQIG